jgi:hypothetical protein
MSAPEFFGWIAAIGFVTICAVMIIAALIRDRFDR